MSLVLVGFLMTGTLQDRSPVMAPTPMPSVTEHQVSVRLDCALTDFEGRQFSLVMKKSGRQTFYGEYSEARTDNTPLIERPSYEILDGSSTRFGAAKRFEAGGRKMGRWGDAIFYDTDDVPMAWIRFPRYDDYISGLPVLAFMPTEQEPKKAETLAGVCAETRLEESIK